MATTSTSPQIDNRNKDLTGRVALVTGGTRGIGAAICHSLAADGAVTFLAQDASSYITGQILGVNGGIDM